jgi:hypothetical protein
LLIIAGFVGGLGIPSFASLAIQISSLRAIRFCRLLQVVRGQVDGEAGRIQRGHAASADPLDFAMGLALSKPCVVNRGY